MKTKIAEISNIHCLVHGRHGPMLVNRFDTFIGKALINYGENGNHEWEFIKQLLKSCNGSVIEVGANNGSFTVPIAKYLAQFGSIVIAFEPQYFIFNELCANLAINGLRNAKAFPLACGAENCTLYYREPAYTVNNSFGCLTLSKASTQDSQSVACIKLDNFIDPHSIVSLIKIDAEGSELDVLKGAENLIKQNRPILFLENDRKITSKPLIEYLRSIDYSLWWQLCWTYNPDNFFKNPENLFPDQASLMMLGLPKEIKAEIKDLEPVADFYHSLMV